MQATQSIPLSDRAQSVHRSGTAAGTLYTVPSGKLLIVMSAWVSLGQPSASPAAGTLSVQAPSEDTGTPTPIVSASVGPSTGSASASTSCWIRVPAGAVVSLAQTGATGATVAGGFMGYLEPAV